MIDLNDPKTYGGEIAHHLDAARAMLASYYGAEQDRDQRYEDGLVPIREPNPFFDEMDGWRNELAELCRGCDLLAFHYTRMIDTEVEHIRAKGFVPTSIDLLRSRVDGIVAEGEIDQALADRIFRASPLHSLAYGPRLDMFWLTAPPTEIDDGAVSSLLGAWGGESAYWCLSEEDRRILEGVGRGRVFCIRMPIEWGRHDGGWMVANHLTVRMKCELGFGGVPPRYDFCVRQAIPPQHIVDVLSEGEEAYAKIGLE